MKNLLLLFVFTPFIYVFVQGQIVGLDVKKYRIELAVSDSSNEIVVSQQIDFSWEKSTGAPFPVFNLIQQKSDKKGMLVTAITQDGKPLTFLQRNDSLYLKNISFSKEDFYSILISFSGIPLDGLVIGENKYGSRTMFGDNWPNRAQNWFVCHDHPSDKALVDFIVTAPKHYEVVANGKLVRKIEGKKNNTVEYTSSVPLSTKIMVVGIAEMKIKEQRNKDDVTLYSCVYPENEKEGFYDFDLAPNILAFYSAYFSPYEYEKLANVQSTTRFGGMENAGCIFYDENSIDGTRSCENLIAHEIVHQWFGNSATESDWPHIWLSEGFATYFTNYYIQQTKGQVAFVRQLKQDRDKVISFNNSYKHPLVDTTYANLMDLLNPNSYQKGGWVLHMLRCKIGDEKFHETIKAYYQKYRLGIASSEDFASIAIELNPTANLQVFFNQWFHQVGHPILKIEHKFDSKDLNIQFSQVQQALFTFPISVDILFQDGSHTIETIEISEKHSKWQKHFDKAIQQIEIDPRVELLFELK
jgi:aminopeptidase N